MEQENAYQAIIRKAWNRARPTSALLELTYLCNHLCTFCNNPIDRFVMGQPRALPDREMTKEEFFGALRKLRELNVLYLTLSGGEPLVRQDFFEIAEEARRLGFAIRIFTNGYLITEEMARRIRDLHPVEMSVSIHGSDAATHDALTRIPGSFDRLVQGVRHLRSHGLNVMLKTPITKLNHRQLRGLKALANGLGCSMVFDPVITPRFDGDTSPLAMRAPEEFYREFYTEAYDDLRDGKPRAPKPLEDGYESCCGTGRSTLMVDPYGNIYPCSVWYRRAGDIKEIGDIAAFWDRSPVLKEVREISRRVKKEVLPMYEHGEFCSFCPALAERMTGDPLRVAPQAHTNALHAHRAWEARKHGPEEPGEGPDEPCSG
jgi:radical SAM protein with 4Fe4S-binding SPASM domain